MRTEGDDLELVRIAAGVGGHPAQHRQRLRQPGAADRDPALRVLDDCLEELRAAAAADEDRQRRSAPAWAMTSSARTCTNSPSKPASSFSHSARIASTDLAGVLAAGRVVDAVVGHLIDVPAESGAEREAAAGELIEGGDAPSPSRSARAARPERCRCRDAAGTSPQPLLRGRRTGRCSAGTLRRARRRPSAAGSAGSIGMWVCSGSQTESSPRSSTALASSMMPMDLSVSMSGDAVAHEVSSSRCRRACARAARGCNSSSSRIGRHRISPKCAEREPVRRKTIAYCKAEYVM